VSERHLNLIREQRLSSIHRCPLSFGTSSPSKTSVDLLPVVQDWHPFNCSSCSSLSWVMPPTPCIDSEDALNWKFSFVIYINRRFESHGILPAPPLNLLREADLIILEISPMSSPEISTNKKRLCAREASYVGLEIARQITSTTTRERLLNKFCCRSYYGIPLHWSVIAINIHQLPSAMDLHLTWSGDS